MMKRLVILAIRGWQMGPSLILPPTCRFQPSCSAYMLQAIEVHGLALGVWLGFRRILRCHPFGGCGHDPVPPVKSATRPDARPDARPDTRPDTRRPF